MKRSGLALVTQAPPVALPTFDLSYVETHILSGDYGADWTPERLAPAVDEYRKFLALCRSYPDTALGISPDADMVWHHHILHTRQYAADCQAYFGYFFHHTPVSTDEENAAAQKAATQLFIDVFGESRLPSTKPTCVATGCMNNG